MANGTTIQGGVLVSVQLFSLILGILLGIFVWPRVKSALG